MEELNDAGLDHIHQATILNDQASIMSLVQSNHRLLELRTNDSKWVTPLLLACEKGVVPTIRTLVELDAQVDVLNGNNQNIIQVATLHNRISALEYFVRLQRKDIPVFKVLIFMINMDSSPDTEKAAEALTALIKMGNIDKNQFYSHPNSISALVKMLKNSYIDDARVHILDLVNLIISEESVHKAFVDEDGITIIIKLLNSSREDEIIHALCILKEIGLHDDYKAILSSSGGITQIIKLIGNTKNEVIQSEGTKALANFSRCSPFIQSTIGTNGGITVVVHLLRNSSSTVVLLPATLALANFVKLHQENQMTALKLNAVTPLMKLMRHKIRDIQINAVRAIHAIAERNPSAQQDIWQRSGLVPLINTLKRTRQQEFQEATAEALWALAGTEDDGQRNMAKLVGINVLVSLLGTLSDKLHFISSEALRVLGDGSDTKKDAIASEGGISQLVRILNSARQQVHLSAIRTLRILVMHIGYKPHVNNQRLVAQAGGIRLLVKFLTQNRPELIQVEAALTLSYTALNNKDVIQLIYKEDFNYILILRLMYSKDDLVRLLAGSALATFAFNNNVQQKQIALAGGVRYHSLLPFLQSQDEFYCANAAFQVAVLSRIIPDEEPATSSAIGIKVLVDLLDSKNQKSQALAANCIARLGHTRAGIPSAIVSIGAVPRLAKLLTSSSELCREAAAKALGYLTANPMGERQLLSICRRDQYLVKILLHHTGKGGVSKAFLHGWKHSKRVGLPPIKESSNTASRIFHTEYENRKTRERGDTFLVTFGQYEPEQLEINDPVQSNSRPPSPIGHDDGVETQSNVSEAIAY
ncbi:Ankyrin and armadillo repeat-containing protein [Trichoplax sp. H2]|nr:Ankyrin and armadillo repeat-containing protein [Trichoplax sp. H2]|eukprot:RDD46956.1 Ankyrin and armadillo repeat-containing protein [Trichoplax sp. H2]